MSLRLQRLVQNLQLLFIWIGPEVPVVSELGFNLGNLHEFRRWPALLSCAIASFPAIPLMLSLLCSNCEPEYIFGLLVERLRAFTKQLLGAIILLHKMIELILLTRLMSDPLICGLRKLNSWRIIYNFDRQN